MDVSSIPKIGRMSAEAAHQSSSAASARKAREAEFHDTAFSQHTRERLWSSWYRVARAPYAFYSRTLERRCAGARVLEYGCGPGSHASTLARAGARDVVGIDISPVAIKQARERAREEGTESTTSFEVMDAEALDLPSRHFDLICGTSILHHLELDSGLAELRRVLTAQGSAIFLEPLGHNLAINLYRRRTPELRTPDEHPLLLDDLEAAGSHFERVGTRFFTLATLLGVAARRTPAFDAVLDVLEAVDRGLFCLAPPLRRYAWQVVIELSRPRVQPAPPP